MCASSYNDDMAQDETICVSPLGAPAQVQPYSRQQFYEEQFHNPTTPLAVHVVNVLLFNSKGDMIVQKRSQQKQHNPGLLDKSIGGHITYSDTPDYTVMVETVQELLTPSIVLRTDEDFRKTHELLRSYTATVAIVKQQAVREFTFNKLHDNQLKPIHNVMYLYLGIYDGSMKPADREASGMLYYPLEQLTKEMRAHPEQFTDDLAQIMRHFGTTINLFLQTILH